MYPEKTREFAMVAYIFESHSSIWRYFKQNNSNYLAWEAKSNVSTIFDYTSVVNDFGRLFFCCFLCIVC